MNGNSKEIDREEIKLASQSLDSDQHVLEWIGPIQHALHATNTQTSEFGFWIKYSVCLSYSIGYTLGSLQSTDLVDFRHHKKAEGMTQDTLRKQASSKRPSGLLNNLDLENWWLQ